MVARTTQLAHALPKHARALATLDLHTVEDLLRHYPRRYYDRGEIMDLSRLPIGKHVTVQVMVDRVDRIVPRRPGAKSMTKVIVTDGRHKATVTFFNDKFRYKQLQAGMTVVASGIVGSFRGARQFTHPEIETDDDPALLHDRLGAIYPAGKSISSMTIRRCVHSVLDVVDLGADPLPDALRRSRGLVGERDALRAVHRPADRPELARAQHRLRFEEAFGLQLALAQRRAVAAGVPAKPRPRRSGGVLEAFDAALPFSLTAGQREVGEELFAELAANVPMHRLLQGEVGSGKTVVALRAMLAVVDSGGQAALLAPTEVLAQQHHRSITSLLGPLGQAGELGGADEATRVALLTGSQPAARRRRELLEVTTGSAGIVVGTHALLEEQVQFNDLGLVVVDEQHRFGVEQRDALRAKGDSPHLLVMTATPIPRTVAMTVFGDLETSTLRELPPGRSPISTAVVALAEHPAWLERAWQRVREEVAAGHRAYIVCPRIDSDDDTQSAPADGDTTSYDAGNEGEDAATEARPPAAAVTEVLEQLSAGPLSGLRLAALHGRLATETKDETMRAFAAGELDVLVATTVIEVGVDVPEATVMVVLDADRFGISQLHQLRGRVGRGSAPGLCLLVSGSQLESPAMERLDGVAATLDGFELARLDLQQRREGDVLGEAQSGRRSSLRLLRLDRDEDLIVAARAEASALVDADPQLHDHPLLAAAVDALIGDQAEFLVKA